MSSCEWCTAGLSGHVPEGTVKPMEVFPDVRVDLCARCRQEDRQITEVISQEDAGEKLEEILPTLNQIPELSWEGGS